MTVPEQEMPTEHPTPPADLAGGPEGLPAAARHSLPPLVSRFLDAYCEGPGAVDGSGAGDFVDFRRSLARLRVSTEPFPSGTIDGFLPDSLYAAVLSDWPRAEAAAPVGSLLPASPTASDQELALVTGAEPPDGGLGTDRYLGSRRGTRLQDWLADDSGPPTGHTWARVSAALRYGLFVRELFGAFADTLEGTLEEISMGSDPVANFRLYANVDAGASEALGAHVDSLHKLLTIVIYVDLRGDLNPDSTQLWGTTLYDNKDVGIQPLRFSPNADHRIAGQVTFAANRAYVMPNSPVALHGVSGGQPNVMRRTLMCGYWLVSR